MKNVCLLRNISDTEPQIFAQADAVELKEHNQKKRMRTYLRFAKQFGKSSGAIIMGSGYKIRRVLNMQNPKN